jgi:hypothetical protein
MVILGNGTAGFKVVSGFGTSGQFLTSNGSGAAPTWTTSAIDQGADYTWTGTHTFSATKLIPSLGQGWLTVSSITGALTSSSSPTFNYLTATSTTASSTFYNLVTRNNASTTNLTISGDTTGGPWSYTGSSTAVSCASGTCTYASNIPANANFGMGTFDISGTFYTALVVIGRSGQTSQTVKFTGNGGVANSQYTLSWSGTSLVVAENTDGGTISGTMYWYK